MPGQRIGRLSQPISFTAHPCECLTYTRPRTQRVRLQSAPLNSEEIMKGAADPLVHTTSGGKSIRCRSGSTLAGCSNHVASLVSMDFLTGPKLLLSGCDGSMAVKNVGPLSTLLRS
jgi:hypothetical protein